MSDIIRQKSWSDDELVAAGFAVYSRKKQLVMARQVSESEAPVIIQWPLETLHIPAGYMLCYDPGEHERPTLADYDYWPVRNDMFAGTYRPWDESNWTPTAPQQHLLTLGCQPYYKFGRVWAKQLSQPTQVQSVESAASVLVEVGFWLLIGALGEPWYCDAATFRARYEG